ncbi:MAG: DUF1569 domain-containing protein [Vicinamibacterales bacterium]
MKTLAREPDKDELLRRLRTVRPESARLWGRMSAHQMICHLCDSCRMATGQQMVTPATSLLKRTAGKLVALYLPVRWPRGIPTGPEIDQHRGGRRPGAFEADVEDLIAKIEAMAAEPDVLEGQVHPVFGRLSRTGWLRWAYLHNDHHLRQFGA